MVKNTYIHIPFCTRKCGYCSFVSINKLNMKSIYIDALIDEITSNYKNEYQKTLYIGGGTPSTLSPADFELILSKFNFDEKTEVTVEINPENITKNYLYDLKKLGINRLSIGIQSFNDKILKIIGRPHNSLEATKVVEMAKNVGFDNISVDLIYGLPTQSTENFENSLDKAISLNIQHISLYGLKIEENCLFYNNKPDFLPDDDSQAEMFMLAVKKLSQAGFQHYEISNFSLKSKESKHNLNYWKNNTYYGFGTSAHGYTDGKRYENAREIENYIKNPSDCKTIKILTEQEILEEEIFLGFRKLDGIDVEQINKKFNIDFNEKYKNIIDKYLEYEMLKKTSKGYSLTEKGLMLSNNILSEFIELD